MCTVSGGHYGGLRGSQEQAEGLERGPLEGVVGLWKGVSKILVCWGSQHLRS